MTCGGPEGLISITFFKERGGKTSSVGQEHYILKTIQELPTIGVL